MPAPPAARFVPALVAVNERHGVTVLVDRQPNLCRWAVHTIVNGKDFIVSGPGHGQPTNPSNRELAAQIAQAGPGTVIRNVSWLRFGIRGQLAVCHRHYGEFVVGGVAVGVLLIGQVEMLAAGRGERADGAVIRSDEAEHSLAGGEPGGVCEGGLFELLQCRKRRRGDVVRVFPGDGACRAGHQDEGGQDPQYSPSHGTHYAAMG